VLGELGMNEDEDYGTAGEEIHIRYKIK